MTFNSDTPATAAPSASEGSLGPVPHGRLRPLRQMSLSTLLLVTASVAIWYSWWLTRQRIAVVREQLVITRPLVHELILKDRDHLAVIMRDQTQHDQYRWQVFVPTEGYTLQIATSGIDRGSFVPDSATKELPPESSVALSPGQHTLTLESYPAAEAWMIEVTVDLEKVIELERPKLWGAGNGSVGGAQATTQQDFSPGQSAILFSRVFVNQGAGGPMQPNPAGNGIRLWIEPPRD